MKLHNAVLCYSDSQDCIDMYFSLWERYNHPLYFYSSEDSFPPNTYGNPIFKAGQSGHSGAHTIERHLIFFKKMLSYDAQWFVVNDYDSFILCDPLDLIEGRDPCIFGNFITTTGVNKHTIEKYQGQWPKFFIHPPYIIHRDVLINICDATVPYNVQGGYFDRWLGLVCEYMRPPLVSFRGSRSSIKGWPDSPHSLEYSNEIGIEVMDIGCTYHWILKQHVIKLQASELEKFRRYKVFHGIRDAKVFNLLINKNDIYEK